MHKYSDATCPLASVDTRKVKCTKQTGSHLKKMLYSMMSALPMLQPDMNLCRLDAFLQFYLLRSDHDY
jgi:hypothetical protein